MQPPEPDDGVDLNLMLTNRNALLGGALVGAVLGVAPLVALIVALAGGSGGPTVGIVLVLVICTPFALMSVAMANAWVKAMRRGPDRLIVEEQGLRRQNARNGFAVPWSALAVVQVVATDGIPGDNPYREYDNPRRRAGVLTAVRIEALDPAGFAAAYPALVVERMPPLPRRLIGAPFGFVVMMESPQRAQLVEGLRRFAGPAFRGVVDETTAGRRPRG